MENLCQSHFTELAFCKKNDKMKKLNIENAIHCLLPYTLFIYLKLVTFLQAFLSKYSLNYVPIYLLIL